MIAAVFMFDFWNSVHTQAVDDEVIYYEQMK
jgi:hypothetical protein